MRQEAQRHPQAARLCLSHCSVLWGLVGDPVTLGTLGSPFRCSPRVPKNQCYCVHGYKKRLHAKPEGTPLSLLPHPRLSSTNCCAAAPPA